MHGMAEADGDYLKSILLQVKKLSCNNKNLLWYNRIFPCRRFSILPEEGFIRQPLFISQD
jgi:hypothetical protein